MSRMIVQRSVAGSALIMSLLMLTVIFLLATAATQMALQGEKSSRNDRDRQIAFQAAEAALADAEADIEQARAHFFGNQTGIATALAEGECGVGEQNPLLGICRRLGEQAMPAWKQVDFVLSGTNMQTVPYGHFTGSRFQTG
uniref:pilus assembly PilX family protein n=1 Tax=uncultured Oxalicibacterium sp. TaxID=1168540 RepID=UPI0025FE37F8